MCRFAGVVTLVTVVVVVIITKNIHTHTLSMAKFNSNEQKKTTTNRKNLKAATKIFIYLLSLLFAGKNSVGHECDLLIALGFKYSVMIQFFKLESLYRQRIHTHKHKNKFCIFFLISY